MPHDGRYDSLGSGNGYLQGAYPKKRPGRFYEIGSACDPRHAGSRVIAQRWCVARTERTLPPGHVKLPPRSSHGLFERLRAVGLPVIDVGGALYLPVGARIAAGVYVCTMERKLGREVLAAEPEPHLPGDHVVDFLLRFPLLGHAIGYHTLGQFPQGRACGRYFGGLSSTSRTLRPSTVGVNGF